MFVLMKQYYFIHIVKLNFTNKVIKKIKNADT